MNIRGLDKARVVKALYENAREVGMGVLNSRRGPIPLSDFKAAADDGYIDYLWGRPLKVQVDCDEIDLRLYDRDAGRGAGERAILEEFTRPDPK